MGDRASGLEFGTGFRLPGVALRVYGFGLPNPPQP